MCVQKRAKEIGTRAIEYLNPKIKERFASPTVPSPTQRASDFSIDESGGEGRGFLKGSSSAPLQEADFRL